MQVKLLSGVLPARMQRHRLDSADAVLKHNGRYKSDAAAKWQLEQQDLFRRDVKF
jgi:hypothetical protein